MPKDNSEAEKCFAVFLKAIYKIFEPKPRKAAAASDEEKRSLFRGVPAQYSSEKALYR